MREPALQDRVERKLGRVRGLNRSLLRSRISRLVVSGVGSVNSDAKKRLEQEIEQSWGEIPQPEVDRLISTRVLTGALTGAEFSDDRGLPANAVTFAELVADFTRQERVLKRKLRAASSPHP